MSISYEQHIYLQEVTENDPMVLSVNDFGKGMTKNYLAAIFTYDNPIFQGIGKKTGD